MKAFQYGITKDQVLAALAAHRNADRLAQGHGYWSGRHACAIGCTLHDFAPGQEEQHQLYEHLFGIPEDLARLEDEIFECLAPEDAQHWPERFINAITPGAHLIQVTDHWLLWLLSGGGSPLTPWCNQPHVFAVAALFEQRLAGNEPPDHQWAAALTNANRAAGHTPELTHKDKFAALAATEAADTCPWTAAAMASHTATNEAARPALWKIVAEALISELRNAS